MKFRLLPVLGAVCALAVAVCAADKATPTPVLTTFITAKKSSITVGSGSIALVKGTKLEVLAREGDLLLVKFHAAQGKVPLADTDFNPDTPLPEATPAVAVVDKPAPAAAVAATPAPATAAKATPPPALSLDQKPASNYGKMVQKAKQVEAAHNDKLVQPSDEILDDKPKK
ncbi:hypothetical protein [Opitutus sp. GAS368]|uniref:hypothetical protein n=1 Tax=Opitutus sp. GAS368 TaxID=1882749 RepID=UPI00087BCDCF|nr:hypothetical protein [Opitutus sp. GAS368]SDS58925.1 hypothetical protein SAMN05444173_3346 [Opitutus sp. GAS368]